MERDLVAASGVLADAYLYVVRRECCRFDRTSGYAWCNEYSIIRAFGLRSSCYGTLLKHFHSSGLPIDSLTTLWARVVAPQLFAQHRVRTKDGRVVFVGDGIKAP